MKRRLSVLLAAITPALAGAAPPQERPWAFEWNARLRHEQVEDQAFGKVAHATSLRVRAGVQTTLVDGLEARLEGEGVAVADGRANTGANGRGAYPVIGDADGVEFNQAWLRWSGSANSATLGRQRITLDNHRWVGNSGWRQNEQTFDAFALSWHAGPTTSVRYAWLDRVHRSSGDNALDRLARERDLDTHLLNVSTSVAGHSLVGYGYLHRDEDMPTASTATWGARYSATPAKGVRAWGLALEAARQREHGRNPVRFSHDYWLVEPALAAGPLTVRAGWEHLGGDGGRAVQMPLATLHAFNGWTDRFLVTPAAGLEDVYVAVAGKASAGRGASAIEWMVAAHEFRSDIGGVRYGDELGASVTMPIANVLRATAKIAHFRADAYPADATNVWLQFEWNGHRTR